MDKKKRIRFDLLILLVAVLTGCGDYQSNKSASNTIKIDTTRGEEDGIWPKGNLGAAENFTGNAYNYNLLPPDSVYESLVGNVYFEPGARSNWHTHPGGQILIITAGKGYHQIEGEPIQIMRKGDVVTCPPNIRHWHGAANDSALHQMYIVPNIEKGIVEWMEPVTDEQYSNF